MDRNICVVKLLCHAVYTVCCYVLKLYVLTVEELEKKVQQILFIIGGSVLNNLLKHTCHAVVNNVHIK